MVCVGLGRMGGQATTVEPWAGSCGIDRADLALDELQNQPSQVRSHFGIKMRTDHVEPKALYKLWEPYAQDVNFDWGFKAYSKCRRSQAADVSHMEPPLEAPSPRALIQEPCKPGQGP